jgi:hypothetical protein
MSKEMSLFKDFGHSSFFEFLRENNLGQSGGNSKYDQIMIKTIVDTEDTSDLRGTKGKETPCHSAG